jgi:hypothetical protein
MSYWNIFYAQFDDLKHLFEILHICIIDSLLKFYVYHVFNSIWWNFKQKIPLDFSVYIIWFSV